MKAHLFTLLILAIWIVSCATNPTATALPTATLTATPTVIPTWTATATPTPLPPLSIQGTAFFAGGKQVLLRGAVIPHLEFQEMVDNPPLRMGLFKKDTDTLKRMGGNFVVIPWNSGFLREPGYVENLVEGIEYAKSKNLTVQLTLVGRGRKPDSTWEHLPITIVDEQVISDWENLLNNPLIAKRIADNVDIFNPLGEPVFKNVTGQDISWSEWKSICERAIKVIREKIGNPRALIAYSGIHYASNALGALVDPPDSRDIVIEFHPYQSQEHNSFRPQASEFIKRQIPFFVGEVGWVDPPEYTESVLEFLVANNISFALCCHSSNNDTDRQSRLVMRDGSYTPNGLLALKYFNIGR